MPAYPELAGKRVLLTGVTKREGAELAVALAENGARLIVNFAEDSPETQALSELMAPKAQDLRIYHDAFATPDDVTRFTQATAQLHSGFDAVVNFLHLRAGEIAPSADFDDVEAHVSAKLMAPCLVAKIAANRMALTWTKGVVLNVVTMDESTANADIAIAGVTKAALSAMTRKQAQEWAEHEVRINAVTPKVLDRDTSGNDPLTSHADIAALALFLASEKGAKLSGHIFEADGISS